MTRQEAEKEAKKLNEVDPQWFCPLINSMCRKDCVNFILAYVTSVNKKTNMLHNAKDDDFTVEGFVCSNAMFITPDGMLSCEGGE